MSEKEKIVNIAVIAHVDAGKSTLVDAFLRQSDVFRDNEEVVDCVMDSNALERERGITIYSKNCSVIHNGVKINIVDTPGHADFSSEVERIMGTVDTVILLVDASEGPMPQTRFVLSKALEIGLKPILLINKIDKKDQRAEEVVDEVYDLFLDLNATDEQLDFPILYGVAREGKVSRSLDEPSDSIEPLFETILEHTEVYPDRDDEPAQMQVSALTMTISAVLASDALNAAFCAKAIPISEQTTTVFRSEKPSPTCSFIKVCPELRSMKPAPATSLLFPVCLMYLSAIPSALRNVSKLFRTFQLKSRLCR